MNGRRFTASKFGALVLTTVLLSACGGGGGSAVSPTQGGSPTATGGKPASSQRATFTITVPTKPSSSAARSRATIVAGTQSITMQLLKSNGVLVNGPIQGPFTLTAGSPGCSAVSAGVTCAFSIDAPIGPDIFVANVYSSTNAAPGTQLGSGAVALEVAANSSNNASLTLNGPIASVVLSSAGTVIADGLHGTPNIPSERIFVVALDATGSVIINPSTYDKPVTLKLNLNKSPSVLTLAVTYQYPTGGSGASTSTDGGTITVNSPSDVITLSLNGAPTTAGAPSVVSSLDSGSAGNTLTFSLEPVPVLALTITDSGNLTVGTSGTYTLTVANTGPVDTSQPVTIVDTAPAPLSLGNSTGSGWACTASGQVSTCTYAAVIAAGTSASPLQLDYTIGSGAIPTVTNTATASGGNAFSSVTASDTAPVRTATPTPVLRVSINHTVPTVSTQLAYAVTLTNIGTATTTNAPVVLEFDPDPSLSPLSFSAPSAFYCTLPNYGGAGLPGLGVASKLRRTKSASTYTWICTSTTPIPPGGSYAFTFTGNYLSSYSPGTVTSSASGSGGGSATSSVSDSLIIPSGLAVSLPSVQLLGVCTGPTPCGASQTLTVDEPGYTGPFMLDLTDTRCTGKVTTSTVSPVSGPSGTFSLDPIAVTGSPVSSANTCMAVVTDNHGGSITVPITVTTFTTPVVN